MNEGVEEERTLASLEAGFKALQNEFDRINGLDSSAENAWSAWTRNQNFFKGLSGEEVVVNGRGDDVEGQAEMTNMRMEDLVFAKTKRRTFFPAMKLVSPGPSDRVKVKSEHTLFVYIAPFSGDILQDGGGCDCQTRPMASLQRNLGR